MTPSGIEPVTFRLVAQCLNQLRHRVPLYTVCTVHKSNLYLTENIVLPLAKPISECYIGITSSLASITWSPQIPRVGRTMTTENADYNFTCVTALYLVTRTASLSADYSYVIHTPPSLYRQFRFSAAFFPSHPVETQQANKIMRRLTTRIRSKKCVVRRFRRCANVI